MYLNLLDIIPHLEIMGVAEIFNGEISVNLQIDIDRLTPPTCRSAAPIRRYLEPRALCPKVGYRCASGELLGYQAFRLFGRFFKKKGRQGRLGRLIPPFSTYKYIYIHAVCEHIYIFFHM